MLYGIINANIVIPIFEVMNVKTTLLLVLSIMLLSGSILGQDKIHKRNKEIIDCKVREIGTESIKYSLPDYPEDVLFAVDKDKVLKVVFEDGREMDFMVELDNPENYVDNKKNAIKLDFISPLTGNTTFAFEHSLKPGRSIEAGLGIIGLGYMPGGRDSKGAFSSMARSRSPANAAAHMSDMALGATLVVTEITP